MIKHLSRRGLRLRSLALSVMSLVIAWPAFASALNTCANPMSQTHCTLPYPNDFVVPEVEAVQSTSVLPDYLQIQHAYQAQTAGFHPQVATVFELLPDVPLNAVPQDGGDLVQVFDSQGQRVDIIARVLDVKGERALIILPETTYASEAQPSRHLIALISTHIYAASSGQIDTAAQRLATLPHTLSTQRYENALQRLAQVTSVPIWRFTTFTVQADKQAHHDLSAALLTAAQETVTTHISSVLPLNTDMPGAQAIHGAIATASHTVLFDLIVPDTEKTAVRSVILWDGPDATFAHQAYHHAAQGYATFRLRANSHTLPHDVASLAQHLTDVEAIEAFKQTVQSRWVQWLSALNALQSDALQQVIQSNAITWHGQGMRAVLTQPVLALAQQQRVGLQSIYLDNAGNWDMGALLLDGLWVSLYSKRLVGKDASLFETLEATLTLQQYLSELDMTAMWPQTVRQLPLWVQQRGESLVGQNIVSYRLGQLLNLPVQVSMQATTPQVMHHSGTSLQEVRYVVRADAATTAQPISN